MQGDVLRSDDIYLLLGGDGGATGGVQVRRYLPGSGWWRRGEGMWIDQVKFTWCLGRGGD